MPGKSAAATGPSPLVTYAEYCRFEADSPDRHYFDGGRILAMAGDSFAHSQICVNVIGELRRRLAGGPCQPIDSNFRIAFPGRTFSHYADGMVLCEPPRPDPDDPTGQSLTNPTLVIEVQSPSTESYDRTTKFDRYRELPGFREFVIVYQDRAEVQTFFKHDDATWLFSTFAGLSAVVPLKSIGVTLPLAEIYDRVTFDATAES